MAMDETPVWSDMVYATVVDATGKKQSLRFGLLSS